MFPETVYIVIQPCSVNRRKDDFLKYLQVAVERNAIEARCILSELFPPETPPQDYYEYAKNNLI